MVRLLAIAAVLVAVSCAPAAATTVTPTQGVFPYQVWMDAAKVPGPAGVEIVETEPCSSGAAACTSPGWPITLGAYTLAMTWRDAREVFYHEVGHHFEYGMPDWARWRFAQLVGDPRPWYEGPNSPNEKFAEGWMRCAYSLRIQRAPVNYGYQYRPTPAVHAKVCRMIATVGAEAGL